MLLKYKLYKCVLIRKWNFEIVLVKEEIEKMKNGLYFDEF